MFQRIPRRRPHNPGFNTPNPRVLIFTTETLYAIQPTPGLASTDLTATLSGPIALFSDLRFWDAVLRK